MDYINSKKVKKAFQIVFLLGVFSSCSKKDATPTKTPSTVYFPKVKSIIAANCMSCHNSANSLGWVGRPVKFDADTDITASYAQIKKAVADPVSPTNRRMPQTGSLSDSEIAIIVNWYNKGGKSTD